MLRLDKNSYEIKCNTAGTSKDIIILSFITPNYSRTKLESRVELITDALRRRNPEYTIEEQIHTHSVLLRMVPDMIAQRISNIYFGSSKVKLLTKADNTVQELNPTMHLLFQSSSMFKTLITNKNEVFKASQKQIFDNKIIALENAKIAAEKFLNTYDEQVQTAIDEYNAVMLLIKQQETNVV